MILSLDPGDTRTGYVLFDEDRGIPVDHGDVENREIIKLLREIPQETRVAIEFPYPRGQLASWQLFATCEEAGRFRQICEDRGIELSKMNRNDVKIHIASSKAKDPQIRQALIDRFGGESAITGPKCPTCKGKGGAGLGKNRIPCSHCNGIKEVRPGILYGFAGDAWAALAVAVTFAEIGASRSSAELQELKKEKKAAEKERKLQRIADLEAKIAQENDPREKERLSLTLQLMKLPKKFKRR